MARGRFISKQITIDERVCKLSSDTSRLLFTWLIPHLDVEGRTTGEPSDLKWMIAAYLTHVTTECIEQYIREWVESGLVMWYRVGATKVLMFPNFDKHNDGIRKDRETPSIFPAPPDKVWDSWNIRHGKLLDSGEGEDLMPVELRENSAKTPAELPQNSGETPAKVKLSKDKEEVKLSEVKLRGAEQKFSLDIHKTWEMIKTQLHMDMSKAQYDTWIKDLSSVTVDDTGALLVICPKPEQAEWCNTRMSQTVNRMVAGITGGQIQQAQFTVQVTA